MSTSTNVDILYRASTNVEAVSDEGVPRRRHTARAAFDEPGRSAVAGKHRRPRGAASPQCRPEVVGLPSLLYIFARPTPCARPEEGLDGAPDRHHSPSRAAYHVSTARGCAPGRLARRMAASGVVRALRRAAGFCGSIAPIASRWAGRRAAVGAAARVSLSKTRVERLECERAHFRDRRAPSSGARRANLGPSHSAPCLY